jgi:hypothetical protein
MARIKQTAGRATGGPTKKPRKNAEVAPEHESHSPITEESGRGHSRPSDLTDRKKQKREKKHVPPAAPPVSEAVSDSGSDASGDDTEVCMPADVDVEVGAPTARSAPRGLKQRRDAKAYRVLATSCGYSGCGDDGSQHTLRPLVSPADVKRMVRFAPRGEYAAFDGEFVAEKQENADINAEALTAGALQAVVREADALLRTIVTKTVRNALACKRQHASAHCAQRAAALTHGQNMRFGGGRVGRWLLHHAQEVGRARITKSDRRVLRAVREQRSA